MLPITLKITLTIVLICYFILILVFLKYKALSLKYTLLWILAGFIMGIMLIFPNLLVYLIRLLGMESSMNGLFVLAIGFVVAILMSITSIVSKQSDKIKILVQQNAMLDKKIRELEYMMKENQNEE